MQARPFNAALNDLNFTQIHERPIFCTLRGKLRSSSKI